MMNIRKYSDLGTMQLPWLNAHYHFSFANYHDPNFMGVGPLRVINDDIVKAGGGFDMHPHKDMEIITYVREGAITHRDNLGNEGRTEAGDVQVMSAGTGIVHAEHNEESIDTNLYQIWIEPAQDKVKPRWEARQFPKDDVTDRLHLLVSGRPEDADSDALYIHQDAAIYGGRMKKGASLAHPISGRAYLLVSAGDVQVNGTSLTKGDGAELSDMNDVTILANSDAEVLVIDLPKPFGQ